MVQGENPTYLLKICMTMDLVAVDNLKNEADERLFFYLRRRFDTNVLAYLRR
jgi:hypothetical protein